MGDVLSSFILKLAKQRKQWHPQTRPTMIGRGMLTSRAALFLNFLGTFLTLWLAVRLLNSLGTCWKALELKDLFDAPILFSIALISNWRALTKADTSRSPFRFNALSDAWVRMVLASTCFGRLEPRLVFEALAKSGGPSAFVRQQRSNLDLACRAFRFLG